MSTASPDTALEYLQNQILIPFNKIIETSKLNLLVDVRNYIEKH